MPNFLRDFLLSFLHRVHRTFCGLNNDVHNFRMNPIKRSLKPEEISAGTAQASRACITEGAKKKKKTYHVKKQILSQNKKMHFKLTHTH